MAEIIGKRVHLSDGAVPFSVVTVRADLGEGARLNVGDTVRIDMAAPQSEGLPIGRDALLAELSRSLRATHPDRAEEMLSALERWAPPILSFGGVSVAPMPGGMTAREVNDFCYRLESAGVPLPEGTILSLRPDAFADIRAALRPK